MLISIISQGLIWAILGLGIFMTFRILDSQILTTGGLLSIRRSRCGNANHQRGSSFISHPGGRWCGVLGWISNRSSLYQREDSDVVIGDFGDDFLSLYHALDYGACEFRPAWNQANSGCFAFDSDLNQLLTGLIFVSIVIALMLFFLDTKLGQAYIATGDNPDMARSFGIHTGRMELMGLVLSNGVIALAGALIAQQEGYADVSRGIGVIVVGLASLIIGEVIFKSLSLAERLVTIVVGSIAYQFLVWAVIALGFNTSYLRLYSAVILAVCLMIPTFKQTILKGAKLSK